MISIRTLDLADLLSAGGEREREKHHYSDTEPEHTPLFDAPEYTMYDRRLFMLY